MELESKKVEATEKKSILIDDIPGSKSITNRVLLMLSLGRGETTVHNFYESEDTQAMFNCLKTLGSAIQYDKNN